MGADLYELRQRNFLKDDPMYVCCIPPGGPRQFQSPYGVQFVEDRDRKRFFLFMGGGNRTYRIIYTDGRAQQGQIRGDARTTRCISVARSDSGRRTRSLSMSRASMKSSGFRMGAFRTANNCTWSSDLRAPTSTLSKYEVTVDDPGAYTRTWSTNWRLQWVPGEELPIYYCQDNRP